MREVTFYKNPSTGETKVAGGYAVLPEDVRFYVEQHQPIYTQAPTEFTRPNETSWTYFKKYLESQK